MKRFNNFLASLFYGCALLIGVSATAVNLPSEWQREQAFDLSTSGLVKIVLPVETLDAARPALEDLRLYDDEKNEIPYVIERFVPTQEIVQNAKSFQVSLNSDNTIITLETGVAQSLDAVTLESPAKDFIKAVRVEGSDDGVRWLILAQRQPIFRQPDGASHMQIPLPEVTSKWLRLTVDDRRSQPIPVTGALLHLTRGRTPPGILFSATIVERDENPGETRIALSLGAANLSVASVVLDTPEPLFMREVSFAYPKVSEDSISEQIIGQNAVYRVAAVEGQTASENMSVPLETLVPSRELFLLIKNGDSPPLRISSVRVERHPIYLVFFARHPGAYHLLTGNAHCDPPRYDLAALRMNLSDLAVSSINIPPPSANPDFRASEVLPDIDVTGATLDVSAWGFRKPVNIASGGAQQIELDIDVLARAQRGLADLRVLRASNQVPYIIQRTSISRALTPSVTPTNNVKNPKSSRWVIKLSQSSLPLTRLVCVATTPLFEREMSLYEELTDERGDTYRHELASGSWTQTPERRSKEFALTLERGAQTDTLFLETENGDNPPIQLEQFTAFYPATRILFKAKPNDELFLYYGNPRVLPPKYDLSLVAGQLLAAERKTASLSDAETLIKSSWRENQAVGQGGTLFWGILATVVVGLLVIISRLLPKTQPPANS
jgi:hypothetical protein